MEELGIRIVRGDLGPDDAFPKEADLEREFGVSRSVIREAVKTLAAKGLLESKTRTGIRALPPMRWNLLDGEVLSWRYSAMQPVQFFAELFEIREMIEPEAAALAAVSGDAGRHRGDRDGLPGDGRGEPGRHVPASRPICASIAASSPPAAIRCCCRWAI